MSGAVSAPPSAQWCQRSGSDTRPRPSGPPCCFFLRGVWRRSRYRSPADKMRIAVAAAAAAVAAAVAAAASAARCCLLLLAAARCCWLLLAAARCCLLLLAAACCC